jgi:hypothetical protein
MKKLLILMLVLGITTAANAVPVLSVNGDTTVEQIDIPICTSVWIDVYNSEGGGHGFWLYIVDEFGSESAGGEWTGNYIIHQDDNGQPAGKDASVDLNYLPNYVGGEAKSFDPVYPVLPGVQFEFEYHCLGPFCEWVYVELWNFDETQRLDYILVHQTPEPASMLLLGLGGLLLRRRK